jgi:1,4-dihydroxy-2-naphthoyl-CoA hydrolase
MGTQDVTEQVKEIGLGALAESMGIEYIEALLNDQGLATVSATMPVAGNTQPYGLLHGGASAVLAETLGSVCAGMTAHAQQGNKTIVVGIDLNCTHHKSAHSGVVTGTATVIAAGKTLICSDIKIVNESGDPICTARLTCLVRKIPQ